MGTGATARKLDRSELASSRYIAENAALSEDWEDEPNMPPLATRTASVDLQKWAATFSNIAEIAWPLSLFAMLVLVEAHVILSQIATTKIAWAGGAEIISAEAKQGLAAYVATPLWGAGACFLIALITGVWALRRNVSYWAGFALALMPTVAGAMVLALLASTLLLAGSDDIGQLNMEFRVVFAAIALGVLITIDVVFVGLWVDETYLVRNPLQVSTEPQTTTTPKPVVLDNIMD